MKIKIMVDSSAGVTLAEQQDQDIAVIRFPLTIDGKEHIDEIDISLSEFKDYLYNECEVSTSQAPLGVLLEMWDEYLKEYDEVVYLPISSRLSGSYETALAASKEYDGRVTIIDAGLVAFPIRMTYDAMIRYAQQGKTGAEIKELIENHEQMFAFIVPYDLSYLKKGGRISPQAAALANLLKIVPILKIDREGIDAHDKVRTAKKAIKKAVDELIEKFDNPEDYHWYILESDVSEIALEYKEYVEKKTKQEVTVRNIYPIILTHTGPQAFVIGVLKKYE